MPLLSAQERRRHFHGELLTVRATKISCTSYHMEILTKAFWQSICAAHIMRIRISLQYIRGRLGIASCSLHNYICSPIFGHAGLCTCSTKLHVVTIQNIIMSLLVCCIFPWLPWWHWAPYRHPTRMPDTRPFIPGKRMTTSGSKSSIFTWLHGLVVRFSYLLRSTSKVTFQVRWSLSTLHVTSACVRYNGLCSLSRSAVFLQGLTTER